MSEKSQVLSDEICRQIDALLKKFPDNQKQSAVLGALHAVQHEHGYLPVPQMDAVAAYLDMAPIAVYEVASFYSMFELKPVGKHTISVCTNLSCSLRGSSEIMQHIQSRLGIEPGETSSDGMFYLKQEEECLAACCGAPMMQVDHVYYENLTPERVDSILDSMVE